MKKNFSIIYNIVSFDIKNILFQNNLKSILKNTSIKKKWVRKQDNNITTSPKQLSKKQSMKNIQTPDSYKEDIINDEKINTENFKN